MSFLQVCSREDSSKSNQFFREKYLYLLPIFIENASLHVCTFCVLYQSLLAIFASFIVFFRCNHQSITMVKIFKMQKVAESTSDLESHIFSKIGELYLTFSKLVFSLMCLLPKDASLQVL
jgi:hypothetical protein